MTETDCPFCRLDARSVIHRDELILVFADAYPVSPGHTLIVPVRHVGSFFATTEAERAALWRGLEIARRHIEERHQPDGYNFGINDGAAAGQTIPHLHLHLIPRYHGDQPDPRGGVRRIFPDRADYWTHAHPGSPE